ncbi:PREDICTED: syndecan-2 isoform X1 [Cercocebus atys]|uniref:syndecan-2 isoform X1 n=1 Tax=Cercocebus atys TaxID=9531 RepID=UPI0005F588F6|nr:PREDICTED: syndecan-2 isoform X1 [Cercocebus atys]
MHGTRPKMLGRRPLDSQSCSDPLLVEGRRTQWQSRERTQKASGSGLGLGHLQGTYFLRGMRRAPLCKRHPTGAANISGTFQRAELTSDKDMYLDNSSIEEASGVYPIDDDDYASASGSGADEDVESPELTTSRPLPKIPFTSAAPNVETTTLNIQNKIPAQTKSPEETDKEKVHLSDSERKMDPSEEDTNVYTEKHSDSLFKRTEVLAAVIAGGVIGFLFAIFLILLLVYRMRKKDEGSYDLGERKPSSAAYQKAPTKEFYA